MSHASSFVGRKVELEQLHGWLACALGGERQVVFVTGEPGMGKTALVDTFLAQAAAQGELGIALGQCVEHYGAGEAYLPVLEALGRLCRRVAGDQFLRLLRRYAPTWLAQMPALLEATEREALQRQVHGATQERMVRELAEAVEVLTTVQPLVLWLEDVQWSDYSTLDLLAGLARRREPARLLVLGTCRPAEVLVHRHPLRGLTQDLQAHRQCVEVPLRLLTVAEVIQYLEARFAIRAQDAAPFHALGQTLHQGTDGNPLFMVLVVDALVAQGAIAEVAGQWRPRARLEDIAAGVPASMRQVIEQQVERLGPEEQQVLETASVIGSEFTAAAVAAGLGTQGERVEEGCEAFVRRGQFLRAQGTTRLPDGTITGRYSFRHAVYQTVLYERLAVPRRIRLHRRIGEGGEALYGSHVGAIAAELARHFERGQDDGRAVHYRERAAHNALQRSAHREAIEHCTKGLALLQTLPDTPERAQQELTLQMALGPALMAIKGNGAPELEQTYARAHALCQPIGETPQRAVAHTWIALVHHRRHEVPAVHTHADALLTLATTQGFPLYVGFGTGWRGWGLAVQGQGTVGLPLIHQGLAAVLATGQILARPRWLTLLADAAGYADRIDEGSHVLAEALTAYEASGQGDWLAEAHRLRGAFLLRQAVPDAAQAEACFQQALAIARRQQAKSWELRAATSLSRLWQQQGKRAEAYDLLAPIYGWFTEGFDTADLQDASTLLAELA